MLKMVSPKCLLFSLCVLCSLFLLCDCFKLHLNRDVNVKSGLESKLDKEKVKFRSAANFKVFDEEDDIDKSEEDDFEDKASNDDDKYSSHKVKEKPIVSTKIDKEKLKTKPFPSFKAHDSKKDIVLEDSEEDDDIEDDISDDDDESDTFKIKETHKKQIRDETGERKDKLGAKTVTKKDKKIPESTSKSDIEIKKIKTIDDSKYKDKEPISKVKQINIVSKADDVVKKRDIGIQTPEVMKIKPDAKSEPGTKEKEEKPVIPKDQKSEKKDSSAPKPKEESKKQEVKSSKTDSMKSTDQDLKPTAPKVKETEKVSPKKEEKTKQDEDIQSGNGVNIDQEQFDVLYKSLPSFAPDYNIVKNADCRREGQIFLRQLRGHKLWALQMLDASAKLPSGILRGNLNQLGDFDACLDASARVKVHQDKPAVPVRGKYCLAEMDFAAVAETARFPVHLLQSRNFIRSNRKDSGHFIPKFTSINWALCLPSACTHEDAEDILLQAIAPYNMTTGLKISLDVKEDMCYTKKHVEWWSHNFETLATFGFYSFIILISCIATLKDCWQSWTDVAKTECESEKEISEETGHKQNDGGLRRMFMAFSIKRSGEELLKSGTKDGDIECIHGIRAFTTLILYCAHKLLPLARIPFSNRTYLTEIANSQWSVILRISLVYTDTFLLLSGVLSAYNMSKDIMNKGQISWFTRLITRYIRLTPALLAVLLFYAYIWDHIGSGPQWSNVVTSNARLCQANMWTNLLYIQNFFPFEEMCATHTHQLALDMQLTVLAPILVWFLYKRPIWGLAILGGFHSLSVGLRYFSTLNHRLSLVIFHGMSHSQLMRTANFSYANALHRATPYLTGVGLGVLLKNTGNNIHLPKIVVALGWMGALYFFGWTLNAPAHLAKRDYQYDVKEAAQFSASASVSWALALSWLIFACHTNNGGSINSILCSRPLVLLSRISYATYLIQFIIFFYNVGTYRSSTVFDITQSFNVLEFAAIITAAIVVTLLFDIPMQTIKSVIMNSTSSVKDKTDIVEEPNEQIEQFVQHHEQHEDYDYRMQENQEPYFTEHEDHQEMVDRAEEASPEPPSEGVSDPGAELDDYEYEDEEEEGQEGEDETTDPPTEKEIGADDQDLQDWEWTDDDKEEKSG